MKQFKSAFTFVVAVMCALAFTVALTASLAQAGDSCIAPCPKLPKETRSVSLVTTPRPAFPAILLTATLKKAMRHRVLKVDAVMTTNAYSAGIPSTLALYADANGILMQPSLLLPGVVVDCGGGAGVPFGPPSFACTVSGSWRLDIDDPANAALLTAPIPPLKVTLNGGEMAGAPAVGLPVDISMTVRMVKK